MHIAITGGAGFIGRAVVERLAARGDQVVALVRDPAGASFLEGNGVRLRQSALDDQAALAEVFKGLDAVIHGAGQYRVGIATGDRPAMWDANVGTTERVLEAAVSAGVPRIVYVSTNNVVGDTHGAIVDETYHRDLSEGFLSWYDETKYRAHEVAERLIADGAPVIIVQPGQAYGPHDHSAAGEQLRLAHAGRLRYLVQPDVGLAWVHVHDLATAFLAAVDQGRIGETYALGGECWRLGEAVAIAARVAGRQPPRIAIPTLVLRMMAPLNDRLGGLPGSPANLAETIRASDGVTYWAAHEKATRELGFTPRSLEQGIADTWGRA